MATEWVYQRELADTISEKAEHFRSTRSDMNEDIMRIPGVDSLYLADRLQQRMAWVSEANFELTPEQLQDMDHQEDSAILNTSAMVLMFLALRPTGHDLATTQNLFLRWLDKAKGIIGRVAHTIVAAISDKAVQRGYFPHINSDEPWSK